MDDKRSVIIIEDDPDLLQMLEQGLAAGGYRCETATDAESAVELLSKTSFDLMVADIVLPGMNGFKLTEKAKKLRPDMLVIMMTGFVEDFSYEEAITAGASDFIKKPFMMHELILRIQFVTLQAKLLKMLITDELTGLYNRRGFFTLTEQYLKLSNRQKNLQYMLYVDLDDLKGINDALGHEGGDQALIETASVLRNTFRQSDIIARIGGDEFVVVSIGTTEEGTSIAMSRLYQNFQAHNEERKRTYPLSISAGFVSFDSESPYTIDELLSLADKSMYEQKRLKKLSSDRIS
jgi:two-component system, cell cycle response regulator